MDIKRIAKDCAKLATPMAISGAVAMLANKVQVWKSAHGGYIACVVAQKIPANPLHVNMGWIVSYSATVPADSTLSGYLVPDFCTFQTAVIVCVAIGFFAGAAWVYSSRSSADPAAAPA